MVKKIISNRLARAILEDLFSTDERTAVDSLIISRQIKRSSAKRYIRYSASIQAEIQMDADYVEPFERPAIEPPDISPGWIPFGLGRKRTRDRSKKTKIDFPHFTHFFEIEFDSSYMVESGNQNPVFIGPHRARRYFAYTSFNPRANKRHAAEAFMKAFPKSVVSDWDNQIAHTRTYRPRLGDTPPAIQTRKKVR